MPFSDSEKEIHRERKNADRRALPAALRAVLDVLPAAVREELLRLCAARADIARGFGELRLRAGGRAVAVLSGRNVALSAASTRQEVRQTLLRVCHGAIYAYRDTLAAGYLPMPFGIRVGVCGQARYDGGRIVGVDNACALVFRFPSGRSDLSDLLYDEYRRGIGRGMLIYAPPGVGKTTALRSLALRIGAEAPPVRAVLIDERGEFSAEDFSDSSVDILRGFSKAEGLALAVRTLSPELLLADEIGTAEEADALLRALFVGVPLIATAHARDLDELSCAEAIRPLLSAGAFDVLIGLSEQEGRRYAAVKRLHPAPAFA